MDTKKYIPDPWKQRLANILGMLPKSQRYMIILYIIFSCLRRIMKTKWNQTIREKLGSLILRIPSVALEYRSKVMNKQEMEQSAAKLRASWAQFATPDVGLFTEVPEVGLSVDQIKKMFDHWVKVTHSPLKEKCFSGMIYSNSLTGVTTATATATPTTTTTTTTTTTGANTMSLKGPEDFARLANKLRELFAYSFSNVYLWNSLHLTEFGIGCYVNYQVVSMVAGMYGGDKNNVMGFITSGGTGSIMLACRSYREWGMRTRGLDIGESVILAADSVHAAFNKGGAAYHMRVVQCRCNRAGEMDLVHLKQLLRKYGKKVVMIVGSAPNYPTGVVDPIRELARIAKKANCGLHVDCCLGGFVINELDHHDTDYLSIDGVTSLSCDTHKNGWAPKGSSVLVTRDMNSPLLGKINLAFFAAYSFPNWSGGFYGTPQEPGSQQCTSAVHAFTALIAVGKNGYREIAQSIYDTCQQMANIIKKHPELKLTVEPQVNVVTFETSSTCNWGKGSIYALSHVMNQNGFQLSSIKGEQLHMCVTGRTAGKNDLVTKFEDALSISIKEMDKMAIKVKNGTAHWPGDAGLYGQLDSSITPSSTNTKNKAELVTMWLIGKKAVEDTVRAFLYTYLNPFKQL